MHYQCGIVQPVHIGAQTMCTTNMALCNVCTLVHDHCGPPMWHCAPGAEWCTTIVHHQYIIVHLMHNGAQPLCTPHMVLCTQRTMVHGHCTLHVRRCAPGAEWWKTIVHHQYDIVHALSGIVHPGPMCATNIALSTRCTIVHDHFAPPIWHVHPVHNSGWGTTNIRLCMCCTVVHNLCAPQMGTSAPGPQCQIGCAQRSCTFVHRVHSAILVVHNGRAPLCTG